MDGIFITGTDTGVGKTTVAAGILKLLYGSKRVAFWKPVQTGTIVGDDTKTVKGYAELPDECFMVPAYRFAEPISPYHAATKWNKKIELDVIMKMYDEERAKGTFILIEGAGGVMVPLAENVLQIDLIKRLKLPLIIVAEDRVGTINHTVLTVNAVREAKVPILGVILTRSRGNLGNSEAITLFAKVPIIAELDTSEDTRSVVAQVCGNQKLRDLLKMGALP